MKFYRTLTAIGAAVFTLIIAVAIATAQSSNTVSSTVSSTPVYVPDYSHAGEPLPDNVINWDQVFKSVDATDGDDFAHFEFSFTNVAQTATVITTTNGGTIASVTNFTPVAVTILSVHPSCGCTTAEIPPTPWVIPAGTNEQFKVKVNLAGKNGVIIKSVTITTDHGQKALMLRINMHPAPAIVMTDAQKAAGITAAKADRQAVFKGDCATCHIKNATGLYGVQLYNAVCGICHEAENRATMVPDLGKLKVPTNVEFWRTWITYGKPGSLMPAFSSSQGGPLSDIQIASLAAYLNQAHPSAVPAVGQ